MNGREFKYVCALWVLAFLSGDFGVLVAAGEGKPNIIIILDKYSKIEVII